MTLHITMTCCVGCRKRKGSLSPNKGLVDSSDVLVTNEVSVCPCTQLHVHEGENLRMHKNRDLHTSYQQVPKALNLEYELNIFCC